MFYRQEYKIETVGLPSTKKLSLGGAFVYLVGIDISKYKHDCFIATETGEVIKNSFSFANNHQGFNELLTVLKSLDQTQEIRIGLEATGHYGNNLKIFLYDNNFSFMEFNPVLSERFRQVTSLRKTKTDKLDAHLISKMLLTYDYKTYSLKSYHILALKSLTRLRFSMVKERTKYKVRLKNIMDLIFPEFFSFFSDSYGPTPMYLLSKYKSPNNIANVEIKALYEDIFKVSSGRYSYVKLVKLQDCAKKSIGKSNDILEFQLQSILNMIVFYNDEINKVDSKINSIMKLHEFYTPTIKGIGVISAASIISEYGNFSLFDSPDKMLSFAGLEPAVYQSGNSKTFGKMVKRGSPYLRYTIMNCSETLLVHNPRLYDYYNKKRNEGKPHRVALTHVAKKLIRIIYKIEKDKIPFNQNLI